jgi:hypothetical protein
MIRRQRFIKTRGTETDSCSGVKEQNVNGNQASEGSEKGIVSRDGIGIGSRWVSFYLP